MFASNPLNKSDPYSNGLIKTDSIVYNRTVTVIRPIIPKNVDCCGRSEDVISSQILRRFRYVPQGDHCAIAKDRLYWIADFISCDDLCENWLTFNQVKRCGYKGPHWNRAAWRWHNRWCCAITVGKIFTVRNSVWVSDEDCVAGDGCTIGCRGSPLNENLVHIHSCHWCNRRAWYGGAKDRDIGGIRAVANDIPGGNPKFVSVSVYETRGEVLLSSSSSCECHPHASRLVIFYLIIYDRGPSIAKTFSPS